MEKIIQSFIENRKWAMALGVIFIISAFFNLLDFSFLSILSAIFVNFLPGLVLIRYGQSINPLTQTESKESVMDDIELACLRQSQCLMFFGVSVIFSIIIAIMSR